MTNADWQIYQMERFRNALLLSAWQRIIDEQEAELIALIKGEQE